MDKKFLVNIIVSSFIVIQFAGSWANVTDIGELDQTSNEHKIENFTLSSKETSGLIWTPNATAGSSAVATKRSKVKERRFLKGRSRRQGYGSFPARYAIPTLFDMCPPLATTCPTCTEEGVQVPTGFCDLVVMKVLAISPPQIDGNGRVCGKFGMLKLYRDFNEKDFRRLLRFSVSETCNCVVKASRLYFLIAPLSTFLKDGLLFNQIVLTEDVVLISADRYIEDEILGVLNNCPVVVYDPEVSVPYVPPLVLHPAPVIIEPPASYASTPTQPLVPHAPLQPPVVYPLPPAQLLPYNPPPVLPPEPYNPPPAVPPVSYLPPPVVPPASYVPPPVVPPASYVPPPVVPPASYVPPPVVPPAPYNPPPAVPPVSYVPPPTEPPAVYPLTPAPLPPPIAPPGPYNPPPVQIPVATSYGVPPVPATPLPSLPLKQIQPSPHRSKIPFIYPSLTKCLIPETCPTCARLEKAGDITGQYCVAGFAYLAVIRVPDASTLQGAESAYSGPTCMNLRTNIVYDITRTKDPKIVVTALTALLPTACLGCFANLSGPVIVMIMGQVPPVPPATQLDANFQVYILPVPSTIVLPSCDPYSIYGSYSVPYSLVPVASEPYAANDCPEASDQTCPLCQNYPDASFEHACANGFAIVTELNLAGPYFSSQRLPAISVKTTTNYYSKSVEVSITNPPPIECIKGFFKIVQSIGLAPLNFPGEIIPFVSLPQCECLSQGFKRLLIFSSEPLIISQEGYLFLSKDIYIAFLQPDAALPTCSLPTPPTPSYEPPPSYIPFYEHHVSPLSARPARVPLTYIPPPPPPLPYTPPNDPPSVYILPPNYIPPPTKQSPLLPYPFHRPLQPTTPVPAETECPSHTTEAPFEETPSPIIECIDLGNGSCAIVDANLDNEAAVFINVDEDIPFPIELEAVNSLIYEDSSVWSPSFKECLSSSQPSCPHNLEESPEKFEEFFCNAKTALLVAVGIDYSILGNQTAATKRLTFIQPELPYVGIDYGTPNNPVNLKVTVTPNKTMERRIQLQNNGDYCYKENVLVLSDISNVLKPKVVVGGLDVYIPGFCDSEIFDKTPSYGILLSLLRPSDVKNPVQLTEDFSFVPLPEGRLVLPYCEKLPAEKPPTSLRVQSQKFWVPTSSLDSVICELTEQNSCGTLTTVGDEFFVIPCDVKSAALVLIQNISAGNSIVPNLEVSEAPHSSGGRTIVLTVDSNNDENAYSSPPNQYSDHSNRCKYATVRILKDLSQSPLIKEDDVLTIIGSINCDNPIFKLTNEVVLLLTDELILPNTVVPLDGRAGVVRIPPGTTTISFCNVNPSVDAAEDTLIDEVNQENDESVDPYFDKPINNTSPSDKKTLDAKANPSNTEYYDLIETSCTAHKNDTCPVCEDIGSLSSEEYCKSGLSLFAEVIGHELENGECASGLIVSLFDLTVRNGVPESKVLKISYTIPTHCPCPVLKEGGHLVLLLDESTVVSDEMSINLSEGKYLYSTPLKSPFPSCTVEDSVQARSKDIENVIVLDSPYEKLHSILPDLSTSTCPTIDHTCPICKSMDDKELENLFCFSDEVLLVSRSKNQKENLRKLSRLGKATFTQHRIQRNYSLEMNIGKYESVCGLPMAVGNCSESLGRYYFDTEDEMCSDFTYTGCGGNANNFRSQIDCEKSCLVEDFCEEGVLDIKKIVKSFDNANYLENKFHYALPEHCSCSQMLKGDKRGYLLSTGPADLTSSSVQLSQNYYFVPLSKNQRKKQFSCPTDGDTADSSENDINDSEAPDDISPPGSTTEKKNSGWNKFWG